MEPFSSLSILLLEDEYLIALDAADILKSIGVKQIQTVNSLAAAAEIAVNGGVDLAILDLNINGELSLGVAELLRKNGVPIVFASGYELRERISVELEKADVYLRKPYTSDSLREAMRTALDQPSARVIPQQVGHEIPARR
jgi:DNA-binding response OmpR family regulator